MSRPTPDRGEVVVYEASDGSVRLEVRLERDSVWLSQRHIAALLDTSTDNVGLHLKNIYSEGELEEQATTEDSSVVQVEGRRKVRRKVRLYNLDAILSVGYRVSSKRGTQFRIWATRTLREPLLRGYTLNERRLREKGLGEMEQAVGLLAKTLTQHALVTGEGRAVLDVVQGYARLALAARVRRGAESVRPAMATAPNKAAHTRVPPLFPRWGLTIQREMGRMSNRDRIARAAEEARLADAEKVAKKAAKATTNARPRRAASPVRMKIVWEVCSPTGSALKVFAYPDKAAAESATQELTKRTGRAHVLRATKVPME